jgi:S-adenosyl methyltransferase
MGAFVSSRNQDPSFSSVDPASLPEINTSVAHPARRYDYWLGGKDNFPADQASGDAVAAAFPTIRMTVVENRRFLVRAVRALAGELGIRQFLDIGTGIPTSPNVHEVAQSIAPDSRVVYVDNDPIVLAHARALLRSGPQGATAYLDADLREPDKILQHPDLLRTLDLSQPVALMLVAILHFIPDDDDPHGAVARLVGAMPPGSYLVVSHATSDFMPPQAAAAVDEEGAQSRVPFRFRTKKEFARFLEGLELIPPGIQPLSEWRAESEPQPRPSAADIAGYAAIARIG